MTREAFIKALDKKRYSYEIEGDKIIIISGYGGNVYLNALTSLPPGVEFRNKDHVGLESLTSLPPGVVFKNGGYVDLRSLTSLPPGVEFGVEFNNEGGVFLRSLTSLPPDVEFNNGGNVWLRDIIGGFFNKWKGNIEGVGPNKLLNKMISLGIFER